MTEKHRGDFVRWLNLLAALVHEGALDPKEAVAIEGKDGVLLFAFSASDMMVKIQSSRMDGAKYFYSGTTDRAVLAERLADELMMAFGLHAEKEAEAHLREQQVQAKLLEEARAQRIHCPRCGHLDDMCESCWRWEAEMRRG